MSIPCILFEDDHLLAVNKPPGINTHAPSPRAGAGIYEWLRHRQPRWSRLAIVHRLDKETSGVLLLAKSTLARSSLTAQFTRRTVVKKYRLQTGHPAPDEPFHVVSCLVRVGNHYQSRPLHPGGDRAETHFRVLERARGQTLLEAEPLTGRTHQIRVHAADHGFPIAGDTLYGGRPAPRLCLHARALTFAHPGTGERMTLTAPEDFSKSAGALLRGHLIEPEGTNAFRLWHGASDQRPGQCLDRLGEFLLFQAEQAPAPAVRQELAEIRAETTCAGVYFKPWTRPARGAALPESSPVLLEGRAAPRTFQIRENGLLYELSFQEGYSVGLFLDQRENRHRLLHRHVATGFSLEPACPNPEWLNAFAYTCAFSVCAARAGGRVTSLDLSLKHLEWGKRNFRLNQLDPDRHDFIYGDVFDWLKRLERKGRTFEGVILDPPTFSRSKQRGVFRMERDLEPLVQAALPLLRPDGVLLFSTNAAKLDPENFVRRTLETVQRSGRKVRREFYAPQPFDFPVSRAEPAHLKALWLRVSD